MAIGRIAHGGLGFNDRPMDDKTIATMNDAEFDARVDRFIERGEDQVTPQTFLQVMTDVAEQRSQPEAELSERVVNGQISFDLPAPLPVGANTRYAGDTKIKLNLRVENAPV
jgi:hypothetical protein